MVYSIRDCRSALLKKGFQLERRTTDEMFYLYYDGKKTSVHTKLSHGRGEDLRDKILGKIRGQLRLETAGQLCNFIECPMTGPDYAAYLIEKRVIAPELGSQDRS
jgi:hypothetical protein